MDARTEEAPQAPMVWHDLRFAGSGGEYFKIWIVNLALTIVTLGIFSAWAKVRTKRYFLGNTFLGEHAFDYHASPLRILLGRAVALVLVLGYTATISLAPKAVFLWLILFAVATPWLVQASLRFNARNTSYRNVRFNFSGTYGGAFKAFVLWPIGAIFSLLIALPYAHRARDYYIINNHSFGGRPFEAEIPVGRLYMIYFIALLMFIGALIVAGVSAFLIARGFGGPMDPKNKTEMMALGLIAGGVYVLGILLISTFVHTMAFNLAINHTRFDETARFEADLSPWGVLWIMVSNLVLTLVTIGLFTPWAAARWAHYQADHLAVAAPHGLDDITSELVTGTGAIGEEIASFFDIDIGL
ncbi:MAG TPA: YjgN family protein [Rhizomicrobium sp.]|jgi:uncharacterized membrane protein YjgN (DUF898 family)